MRLDKSFKVISVGLILLLTAGSVAAQDESEHPTSAQERHEAQKTARQFVRRLQQTRDVEPLIRKLFVPNFISHFVSDCECMSPEFYARLSLSERRRWFVAQNNFSYLVTLDVLNSRDRNPSDPGYEASAFKSILPDKLAERLRTVVRQETDAEEFKDYESFRTILVPMEQWLAEARSHLLKKRLEQTREFQQYLDDKVTNMSIGYRVRAYVGGRNIKDCPPLKGFPAKQKFYRVEIPLMMGVILVKHGTQMRIVTLTFVDGD